MRVPTLLRGVLRARPPLPRTDDGGARVRPGRPCGASLVVSGAGVQLWSYAVHWGSTPAWVRNRGATRP